MLGDGGRVPEHAIETKHIVVCGWGLIVLLCFPLDRGTAAGYNEDYEVQLKSRDHSRSHFFRGTRSQGLAIEV